jgi:putative endonuclease
MAVVRKGLFRSLWLAALSKLGDSARTGKRGERAAERWLKARGYILETRNFRTRGGEADLIFAKDGRVVVVEVKTRTQSRFGAPQDAVTPVKQRRVLKAGMVFCRRRGIAFNRLRGDVVTVVFNHGKEDIRHYPGVMAFSPPR